MEGGHVSSGEGLRIDSNQYTWPSMAKPKGKNPDDLVWHSNSLQESDICKKKEIRKKAETKHYKKIGYKIFGTLETCNKKMTR